jgi:hypothetical protein
MKGKSDLLLSACASVATIGELPLRNGWKPGTPLPKRLALLRKGDNPGAKGTFTVTDATLATLSAFQRKLGRERVALDFEHNTCPGTPEYDRTHEPREVAAFGTVTVLDDLMIILDALTWTPAGEKMAPNFEDISPVLYHGADGAVLGIHSVGLVKCGSQYGLTFLSADDPNQENSMDPEKIASMIAEAVAAAIAPLAKRLEALEGKSDPDMEACAARVLDAKLVPFSTAITALTAADAAREKEHLIRCAMIDGKDVASLTPATITALSVPDLKAQLDALKAGVIPLSARTVPGAGDKKTKSGPTDQQSAVARNLGLDPAKVAW